MAALVCGLRWGLPPLILPLVLPLVLVATTLALAVEPGPVESLVRSHCLDCHDQRTSAGGLSLESLDAVDVGGQADVWERVVRKLRTRQMPPVGAPRPAERSYGLALEQLESALDEAAAARPRAGRTETFRRLNRTEYQHAIRDLLALEIDAAALLPADDASHGFDNVTVGDLSPTLLNRYITAAERISRRALGRPQESLGGDTFRIRADITQEEHVAGLPLGTRGGTLLPYHFPQDGEYEIQVRLMRDRNEQVEGLAEPHELLLLLDRRQVAQFTVRPPRGGAGHDQVDAHLKTRIQATAGPHGLGVTFVKQPASLLETRRQPYHSHFNMHRHPRISPAVFQVSITGPYQPHGPGDTVSRRRILICEPHSPADEEACARRILSQIARRAYRRPVTEEDLRKPLEFFREGSESGGFEGGIELALSSVLVSPSFLFHIERDPAGAKPQECYRLSDIELASRLSFFLWSSIPDDELLACAERGELSRAEVWDRQVRRMLADERAESLATNFAAQWLYLRNLDSITPDGRLFPDFDDNLRQAFRRETELLLSSVIREDRSLLDLLRADHTHLNERLAKHYGIPHIYGSHFRRVPLDAASHRGGLLRHGSVLTVTSYATRTSPVVRGHWILKNLLAAPPPPPPADVPALKDNSVSASLGIRQRLAEHRDNEACASCHSLMDPLGFALENFDAVGRWRDTEAGRPLDATGSLAGGPEFVGVDGLERTLLGHSELFVAAVAEKLLTYAIGRGMEPADGAALRRIVRESRAGENRFSALVLGVTHSTPFQMRTAR